MITSQADGHAHLWYHVPYSSLENVLGMTTQVSICKYCTDMLARSRISFDIGCPEVQLHNESFHVRIGEAVVEQWRLKEVREDGTRSLTLDSRPFFFQHLVTAQQLLRSS